MPPGSMVESQSVLPLGTMPGFVVLQQQESVTTEDQADLWSGLPPGGISISEDCAELAPSLTWSSWES